MNTNIKLHYLCYGLNCVPPKEVYQSSKSQYNQLSILSSCCPQAREQERRDIGVRRNEWKANRYPHSRQWQQPLIINRGPKRGLFLIWFGFSKREGTRAPPTHPGMIINQPQRWLVPSCPPHFPAPSLRHQWGWRWVQPLHRGSESRPPLGPKETDSHMFNQGQIMSPSRAATDRLSSHHPGVKSQNWFSVFSEDSRGHLLRNLAPALLLH